MSFLDSKTVAAAQLPWSLSANCFGVGVLVYKFELIDMVPEEKISPERFPATRYADVLFGAVSGAILASISRLTTIRLLVPSSPPYLGILIGAIIGAFTGAVAGSIHNSRRTTFNNSELGIPLAIAFALIPSLILFLNAFSVAGGTLVKSIAAVGFAGVMVGVLLGAILDRVYETILKRFTRDGR